MKRSIDTVSSILPRAPPILTLGPMASPLASDAPPSPYSTPCSLPNNTGREELGEGGILVPWRLSSNGQLLYKEGF